MSKKKKNSKIKKLEKYYNYIQNTLLPYQSADLGLFSSYEYNHEYGDVRENVYCAICLWAGSIALKQFDDISGKSHELEYSSVKCMRAILFCLMLQTSQLEEFKKKPDGEVTLSNLFNVHSGIPYEGNYKHLQIDAISLYLLVLCQMVASGCSIIFNKDEASFIQNLIFYIERNYRTIDYGMWGSGSRYSHTKELNASSIGMAKAALEAANGLNILGKNGDTSCVLYSDPDAHHRNHEVLHNFLPRESSSKEIDIALLTICGFPAFAVDSIHVKTKTLSLIESKLKGNYGYKRFPLDAYGVPSAEITKEEENVDLRTLNGMESQWPMFYAYQAINYLFDQKESCYQETASILKKLLIKNISGYKIMPKYYAITEFVLGIDEASINRIAYPSDDHVFLWGQAIFLIFQLLKSHIIQPSALDPLRRYSLHSYSFKPYAYISRYSSYKTNNRNSVVQLCFLSYDVQTQTSLSVYGVTTQNLNEIEPAIVVHPHEILSIFSLLGKNERLGLSGRPNRPIGIITCCKIFHSLGKILVTFPLTLEDRNFYLSNDIEMVIQNLKTKIRFISKTWSLYGRPTLFLVFKREYFAGDKFSKMMKFIYDLKSGNLDGVTVRVDRFQNLLGTACNEYIEYLPDNYDLYKHALILTDQSENVCSTDNCPRLTIKSLSSKTISAVKSKLVENQSTDICKSYPNLKKEIGEYDQNRYLSFFEETSSHNMKLTILGKFAKKEGIHKNLSFIKKACSTVKEELLSIFNSAKVNNDWSCIRYAAALLDKVIDALTPSISNILVTRRILVLGSYDRSQFMITDPVTPAEIIKRMKEHTLEYEPRDLCLQQELIIHLTDLIISHPDLFVDISKINLGWIIKAMKSFLKWSCLNNENNGDSIHQSLSSIYSLSPSQINNLLLLTLKGKDCTFMDRILYPLNDHQKRFLNGSLCKVPQDFYNLVWKILENCPNGIQFFDEFLPQLPTLYVMTPNEINFTILIEVLLSSAKSPEQRQLCVEMILVVSMLLERNPEIEFNETLNLQNLIEEAKAIYLKGKKPRLRSTIIDYPSDEQGTPNQSLTFESLPSRLIDGTAFYMMQAVINRFMDEANFNNTALTSCIIS